MWTNETPFVVPDKFIEALASTAPHFAEGNQEDSHEFLAFLLDILHEDLNRVTQKPRTEDKEEVHKELEVQAAASWKNYLLRNKSVIVDVFQVSEEV
jgi:ubiquitin C-terminal hydrolase